MAYNCLWLMNRKERSKVKMLCLLCYKGKQRIFPYSLPFCQHMHIDIFSCNPYNKLSSTFEPFSYFLFFSFGKVTFLLAKAQRSHFLLHLMWDMVQVLKVGNGTQMTNGFIIFSNPKFFKRQVLCLIPLEGSGIYFLDIQEAKQEVGFCAWPTLVTKVCCNPSKDHSLSKLGLT